MTQDLAASVRARLFTLAKAEGSDLSKNGLTMTALPDTVAALRARLQPALVQAALLAQSL